MFEIMDEMCELIYVADIKNYNLLYMNTAGRTMFNIDYDLAGKKCYKVLQGLDAPCPFCTNHLLDNDKVYSWEFTNPTLGRHYLLKDKKISWKGIPARMEIAFDITDSENEKITLKNTLESERVMLECIRQLHLNNKLEDSVPNILETIGKFLQAGRAYVFEFSGGLMYNTYEWCAPGVTPEISKLQGLDQSLIDDWMPEFLRNECHIMENIEDIRENDPEAYRILGNQNITSIVCASLERNGKIIGYIGVDNPPKERISNVSVMFNAIRYFLASSMSRIEDESNLRKLSYYDTLTGAYNRNRYIKDTATINASETSVGVAYFDINGLKDINDQLGHAQGNLAIISVVQKVKEAFGNYKVYRLGGDEFVVICPGCPRAEFEKMAEKARSAVNYKGACSAAMGHKWSEHSREINQLITWADAMMYEDKKQYYRGNSASNRYRHHNDDIVGLKEERYLLQQLESGRFGLEFKPVFSLQDHTLVGLKAVANYTAGDGYVISGDQFMPLLEEQGLAHYVDFYIFDKACQNTMTGNESATNQVPTCVQLSKSTMERRDYKGEIKKIMEKHKADGKLLTVEVSVKNYQPYTIR